MFEYIPDNAFLAHFINTGNLSVAGALTVSKLGGLVGGVILTLVAQWLRRRRRNRA